MKFNVGQKVRLRKDLVEGEKYGEYEYDECLHGKKGETLIISHVYTSNNNCRILGIDALFSKEMLEEAPLELTENTIVVTRNGNEYLVVRDNSGKLFGINSNGETYYSCFEYDENFCVKNKDSEFDIMKIYKVKVNSFDSIFKLSLKQEPIWERNQVKELTVKQISELLGYSVKVVE